MNNPCVNVNLDIYHEINGKISIFHRSTGKTYVIGSKEYSVLKELDGTKSINKIAEDSVYSVDELNYLIQYFEKLGFIKGFDVKAKFNLIRMKKPLVNGNKLINPETAVWKILNFIILYFSIPLFLLGCLVNINNGHEILNNITNNLLSPGTLIVLPITLVMLSLHELGHAVVARCLNVNVPEIGFMVYWFMPCAYTNLSGINFLDARKKRILCLVAGMFVNVLLAGIGLLLLPFMSGYAYRFTLWLAVSNLGIILMNLVVFLKLDGYFLLEEFVGMKGLRKQSFDYLRNAIRNISIKSIMIRRRNLKYRTVVTKDDLPFIDRMIFIFYAVCSALYLPMVLLVTFLSLFSAIMERF